MQVRMFSTITLTYSTKILMCLIKTYYEWYQQSQVTYFPWLYSYVDGPGGEEYLSSTWVNDDGWQMKLLDEQLSILCCGCKAGFPIRPFRTVT